MAETTELTAARKASGRRVSTQSAMRAAAITMFSKYGYHAVTLRKLADQIGLQAGSLYNHIESKQSLLFDILQQIMVDLLESYNEHSEGLTDPEQRLDAFIENHIRFHIARKEEVFIGNMELRNLEPANYAKLVSLRDQYQRCLSSILEDGQTKGEFRIKDLKITTYAIFGMLNNVSGWASPDGPQSAGQIVDQYRYLVWCMVKPNADLKLPPLDHA